MAKKGKKIRVSKGLLKQAKGLLKQAKKLK